MDKQIYVNAPGSMEVQEVHQGRKTSSVNDAVRKGYDSQRARKSQLGMTEFRANFGNQKTTVVMNSLSCHTPEMITKENLGSFSCLQSDSTFDDTISYGTWITVLKNQLQSYGRTMVRLGRWQMANGKWQWQ